VQDFEEKKLKERLVYPKQLNQDIPVPSNKQKLMKKGSIGAIRNSDDDQK